MLAQPSWLWAQLPGCKESGGSSFFWLQASVSGEPGITTMCFKKKDSLFYQEMALKDSLLATAPHCSNLFSEHTLTVATCITRCTQAHLHLLHTE